MTKIKPAEGFYFWAPRIQTTPEVRKKVERVAIAERRSLGVTVGLLIEEALEARENDQG